MHRLWVHIVSAVLEEPWTQQTSSMHPRTDESYDVSSAAGLFYKVQKYDQVTSKANIGLLKNLKAWGGISEVHPASIPVEYGRRVL